MEDEKEYFITLEVVKTGKRFTKRFSNLFFFRKFCQKIRFSKKLKLIARSSLNEE